MELFSLGSLRLDGLQLHGSLDRKVLKKGLKKRCSKKSQDAVCVIVCYWEIGGIRWYCNHEKQLSASYSLLQSLRRHLSFHVGFKVLEQKLPGSNATYAKSSCIWHVCVCVRKFNFLNMCSPNFPSEFDPLRMLDPSSPMVSSWRNDFNLKWLKWSKWSVVGGTGKREALPKEKAWAVLSHGYWGPMAPVRQSIAKRCLTDIHGNIIHYNTIIWKNNTLWIHQPKYPKTSIAVYPTTLITLIALKREEKHMQKNNTLTHLLLELACLVAIESCCR